MATFECSIQAMQVCLVTSRREPDIRQSLQTVASCVIDIDPAIKEDVAKLVAFALQQDSMRRWGDIMATLIVPKLLGAEERRFRWTDLQIKRLSACPTEGDLLTALDTLPETLDEAYHQALATIPSTLQERVRKILIWLASSFREMTSREIAAVVSFPFVDDVLKICTSLLVTVIDGDTHETIKLAHFTVKEFLIVQQSYDESLYWYKFTAQLAHCCITDQIIHYVFPSSISFPKALRPYAEAFWLAHARQNDATTDWAETQLLVDCILKHDNILFKNWLRANHPAEACAQSPLYYASLLGLEVSVMNLWRELLPGGNENEILGSIVTTAARMGHVEIVRWLVGQSQDVTSYIDLPRIVECLRVNIHETLCDLLQKRPKISLSAGAIHAATKNTSGEVILGVLLDQELVTLAITEDIIEAAAHNHWNRKILDMLVWRRVREFPVTLRALLAVAKTSLLALEMLMDHRRDDIIFQAHDYSALALEQSVYTVQKLLSQGVKVPITPALIESMAGSPCGSEMLELLLDHCAPAHSLSKREVYAVAACFDLKILIRLMAFQWDEDVNANDLSQCIAYSCYIEPPKRTKLSERAFDRFGRVHRDYRPTLRRPNPDAKNNALRLLLVKAGSALRFTKDFLRLVATRFDIETFVHVLDHFIGKPILADATRDPMMHSLSDVLACIDRQDFKCGIPEDIIDCLQSMRKSNRLNYDSSSIRSDPQTPKEGDSLSITIDSFPALLQHHTYSDAEFDSQLTIFLPSVSVSTQSDYTSAVDDPDMVEPEGHAFKTHDHNSMLDEVCVPPAEPYQCQKAQCSKPLSFKYSGGLLRHEREVHGMHGGPEEQLFCPIEHCRRHTEHGFTRRENLEEHLRRMHKLQDVDSTRDAAQEICITALTPFDHDFEGLFRTTKRKRMDLWSHSEAQGRSRRPDPDILDTCISDGSVKCTNCSSPQNSAWCRGPNDQVLCRACDWDLKLHDHPSPFE
ncbi:hypothetical protein D6C79_05585 [Aureobasidium pullulans]|nr:hypothetical protein D6C79_05585 [Aureobasidium pullulans]